MLSKERYLELKNLATKTHRENRALFMALKNASIEDSIKEKEEFLEAVLDKLDIDFAPNTMGKEEKVVFRANLLIPDDEEFLENYNNDKNVRFLANKYGVSAEDVINKIFELNKYNDSEDNDTNFVDEIVKQTKTKKTYTEEPKVKKHSKKIDEEEDFNGVLDAVTDFTSNYKNLEAENTKLEKQIDTLNDKLDKSTEDALNLSKELDIVKTKNDTLNSDVKTYKENSESLKDELKESKSTLKEHDALAKQRITEYQKEIDTLDKKLAKAEKVLKSIYESVSTNK